MTDRYRRIKAVGGLAVPLATARTHLRVTDSDSDADITQKLTAAIDLAEGELGRPLLTQTWEMITDGFGFELVIRRGGVSAIEAVSYWPADGGGQRVLDPATVAPLLIPSGFSRLRPAAGHSWPAVAVRPDAVTVRYRGGYGAPSDVPARVQQAVLLLLTQFYDGEPAKKHLPYAVRHLLAGESVVTCAA